MENVHLCSALMQHLHAIDIVRDSDTQFIPRDNVINFVCKNSKLKNESISSDLPYVQKNVNIIYSICNIARMLLRSIYTCVLY